MSHEALIDFFTQQSETALSPLELFLIQITSVNMLVRITTKLLNNRKSGLQTIITILEAATQLLQDETTTQLPPLNFLDQENFDTEIPQPIQGSSTEIKLALLPSQTQITYIGDLHGDFSALLKVLQKNDPFREENSFEFSEQNLSSSSDEEFSSEDIEPQQNQQLVFLGDYLDRGPYQLEVILTLLLLKLKFPHKITLLRGNHEFDYHQWLNYGSNSFGKQLKILCKRLDCQHVQEHLPLIIQLFQKLFHEFPIIAISPHGTIATHGAPFPGNRNIESIPDLLNAITICGMDPLLWSEPFPMKISSEELEDRVGEDEDRRKILEHYQGQGPKYVTNLYRGAGIYLIDPTWLLNNLKGIPGFRHLVTAHQHCFRQMSLLNSTHTWYVINTSGVVGTSITTLVETNGQMIVKTLETTPFYSVSLLTNQECSFIYERNLPEQDGLSNLPGSLKIAIPTEINGKAIASFISALFQSVTLLLNIQHIGRDEAIFLWTEILKFLHTNQVVQNSLRYSFLTTEKILSQIAQDTGLNLLAMSRARGSESVPFFPLDFGYLLENGKLHTSITDYIRQICPIRQKISNRTTNMSLLWNQQPNPRTVIQEYEKEWLREPSNPDAITHSRQSGQKRRRRISSTIKVEI